jgi:hypothetical protein
MLLLMLSAFCFLTTTTDCKNNDKTKKKEKNALAVRSIGARLRRSETKNADATACSSSF